MCRKCGHSGVVEDCLDFEGKQYPHPRTKVTCHLTKLWWDKWKPFVWSLVALFLWCLILVGVTGCGSSGDDGGGGGRGNNIFVPQTAVWDVYYGAYQTRLDLVGGSTIRVEVCCGRVTVEDDGYAVEVW